MYILVETQNWLFYPKTPTFMYNAVKKQYIFWENEKKASVKRLRQRIQSIRNTIKKGRTQLPNGDRMYLIKLG